MRSDILIIEDDATIRENLKELLEEEGFKVATANNGKEGLERAHQEIALKLILLDLMMPVMTGEEFLEQVIQSKTERIIKTPVIVLSASERALDTPVAAYFRKPININLLLDTIHQLVK